jgi:hypothetical protein
MRRIRYVVAIAVIGMTALAADLALLVTDDRSVCERASEFVAAHASQLPRNLDEISAFPLGYRQRIYSALPITTKSEMWREHLSRFLSAHRLTAAQSGFVQHQIAALSPDAIASGALKAQSGPVSRQAIELFGRGQAKLLVATLGPRDPTYRGVAAARLGVAERVRGWFVAEAQQMSNCSCAIQSDWCGAWNPVGPYSECVEAPPPGCIPTVDGCGTWFEHACTGKCR